METIQKSNDMNTTLRFQVDIILDTEVTNEDEKNHIAQSIARAIVNEVNSGQGLVSDEADNFTRIVYVKEWYSDKQIIEHI